MRWIGVLLLAFAGCTGRGYWDGRVHQWGELRQVMRDGRTEGRLALADLSFACGCGVGACEGLDGEITMLGGQTWVSRAPTPDRLITERAPKSGRATLLAVADVPRWVDVPVERDVAPEAFDDFVRDAAIEHGIDPAAPFPFVVVGMVFDLDWHVVRGACPHRPVDDEGSPPPAPFCRSDSATEGRIVGIHAENAAGVLTHRNSRTHVHVIVDDGAHTGHVDRIGVRAGATLRLPAVRR